MAGASEQLNSVHVAVLAGGPDAEHEVSLMSGRAVAESLRESGVFREISYHEFHETSAEELAAIRADVFFPALHGRFGEGGPLQRLLEQDGRPFVGSGSRASALAMDKIQTKEIARSLGVLTPDWDELTSPDQLCPFDFPVVVKPVDDGSSVNVFICESPEEFERARQRALTGGAGQRYVIEQFVPGRELTVGIVGDEANSLIEIVPSVEFYDYEAKYEREDTDYNVHPQLPTGLGDALRAASMRIFHELGCKDLARVDFRVDDTNPESDPMHSWSFLEINTIPGFTSHSLVPMGAKRLHGWSMAELCTRLILMALARGGTALSFGTRHATSEPAVHSQGMT